MSADADDDEFDREAELDDEDVGDDAARKRYDPRRIRITTKNFRIREMHIQIAEGQLDLAPDFQRSFVWKRRQQVRLVESIMLGIPLPALYFNQDDTAPIR